jgi:hypothetical protein
MPAPTPNIGQLISRTNTGPSAVVTGSSPHAAADMALHTGNFTTSSDGEVVQAKNITGLLLIRNNNVKVTDCKARGVVISDNKEGIVVRWSEFGNATGNDTDNGGTTCFQGGGYTLYRCQFYGWVDLLRSRWGDMKVVECWLGPMYADPNGHSDGGRAHCDPNQPHPPPGGGTFKSLLMQGCRIDSFVFEKGENYLTRMGSVANGPATAGFINTEYGVCSNGTVRDCYIDGNYSQCCYIINGDNNTHNGRPADAKENPGIPLPPPANWVFIDNIFKSRRANSNRYGSTSFMNFGKYAAQSTPEPTITWGRNVDADSGATLAAFYKTYAEGTNHSWSKTKNAGPSDTYPSYYTTGPPPPPPPPNDTVTLLVTTPADESTHTSGPLVFVGGPDAAQDDSAANYNYFNYYLEYVNAEGNVITAHLDRDNATNNTGFTFSTITTGGVTFTDRSSVQHTVLGEATLRIVGERKDGTGPKGEITVTFGEEVGPPGATDVEFTPTITGFMAGKITVDTTTGGIDPAFIERVSRSVPATYRVRFVWKDSRNGREVVYVDGIPIYKGQG